MRPASSSDAGGTVVRLVDVGTDDADPSVPTRPDGGGRRDTDGWGAPSDGRSARGGRRTGSGPRPLTRAPTAARAASALVLVAAVLAGAQAVEDHRAAERAARFAVMPGTVAPLDRPLVESWSVTGVAGVTRVGRLALVTSADDRTVRAVDVVDGRTAWRLATGGPAPAERCLGDRSTDAVEVLVCFRGRSGGGAPGTVTAVVVDASDGSVLAQRPTHLPSHGAAMVGGDLVTVQQRDRVLDVRRTDAVTRAEVWAARIDLAGGRQSGSGAGRVRVEHGVVVVEGATTGVLDAATGRVLGVWHADGWTASPLQPALDGADVRVGTNGWAVSGEAAAGRRSSAATWFDRTGRPVATLDGALVEPEVSDGSLPEVVLTARPDTRELVATDVAAGRELWRARAAGTALLRRDGAAVVAGAGRVASVDLRTGDARWDAAVPGVVPAGGSVTDGSTVVVVVERSGRARLVALDLDTGSVRWEAPLPGDVAPLSQRVHDQVHVTVGEVAGRVVVLADRLVAGMA
ncbi:hypothetical protein GCM10010972_01510 [Cellulomonas carbonis]|nr:hypothetical protein GCM10010972_01510 [Cellulomonas carbonis]